MTLGRVQFALKRLSSNKPSEAELLLLDLEFDMTDPGGNWATAIRLVRAIREYDWVLSATVPRAAFNKAYKELQEAEAAFKAAWATEGARDRE